METGNGNGGKNSLMLRVQRILRGSATFEDRFVSDHDELLEMARILRSMGCAIGYTEGVFDLFHIGHADYLKVGKDAAVKVCSSAEQVVLVVGADSDALTKSRKGPGRPIAPEGERCQILGHLRSVDIITVLHEPEVFNRNLHPEVRIISESTGDNPDKEDMKRYCDELVCLPPQRPTGTTATIRTLALEGGVAAIEKVRHKLVTVLEETLHELG
ncbi:MAG: adenylyltransferase/cytidyltransferase family protein [Candidatus Pacebacteria bacterium]|nr:adenylyltransferase/cytidyltransferase family protein [Candidatus Paceibacterota bacterium]